MHHRNYSRDGINGKTFGPPRWSLLLSLAHAIDRVYDVWTLEQRQKALDYFRRLHLRLPCSVCRISAECFQNTPPVHFMGLNALLADGQPHVLLRYVYWLKVMVTRKLFRQEMESVDTEDHADVRSRWRSANLTWSRLQVHPIHSPDFHLAIVETIYYLVANKNTRIEAAREVAELSHILHNLGHVELAKWTAELWTREHAYSPDMNWHQHLRHHSLHFARAI